MDASRPPEKPATFDVIPLGDLWKIRGTDGRTLLTVPTQKAALDLAWTAAMENRPATARLLTVDGAVEKEWNYPAN